MNQHLGTDSAFFACVQTPVVHQWSFNWVFLFCFFVCLFLIKVCFADKWPQQCPLYSNVFFMFFVVVVVVVVVFS